MALTQVSTGGVKDGSLLNADINASAAIASSKLAKPIDLGDNEKIRIGASADLQIYHDGSTNVISGQFHPIELRHQAEVHIKCVDDGSVELYHDNSQKLVTKSYGIFIDGHVQMDDNDIIKLGNSNDLQLYHDGSHSYVDQSDSGTGNLHIRGNGSDQIKIQAKKGEQSLICNPDGGVELYYDNSKKFETTSTGIDVSGNDNTFSAGANAVNTTFISSWGGAGATSAIRVKMNSSTNDGLQFQQAGFNTSIAGGNHASTIFNREDAKLRLGTDNTEQFRIEANGDLKANDTSIGSLSDSRLKKNIVDFTYDLSKFKQFKPKKFDWINPKLHGNKSNVRGFIAQEIEAVDSTLVGDYELYDETLTDKNPDLAIIEADDGTNIAKDSKLGTNDAMYISVIQQMLTKIEVLETEVAALKAV